MARTSIEWTDRVWNPVRGCSRVSPGCDNCYAMRQAHRSSGPGGAYEGLTRIGKRGVDWAGFARLIPEQLDQPLRWRRPRRIFVNSMSDLFHPSLTNEEITRVFAVMVLAEQHTFQVLTKRPARAAGWFAAADLFRISEQMHLLDLPANGRGYPRLVDKWPLPNVWLGVSVEDRAAKVRIDQLRELPAALRFLSLEPLIEDLGELDLRGIDWVIVGGESGHGARPFDVAWTESIVQQCREAKVACFVKQLGALPFDSRESDRTVDEPHPGGAGADPSCRLGLIDRKGGDMREWPEHLRVREFPAVPGG